MVDYSKFADIDTESSSQSDDGTSEASHQTFPYPLGVEDPCMRKFDTRDEACKLHGFRHGDVVVTDTGKVSAVIGVHGTSLYFHAEGFPGAGTWSRSVPLKAIARTSISPGRQKDSPSAKSDWLKLDFSYVKGLREVAIWRFDVRDQICKQVGGFTHGQIIEVPGMSRMVTIGVQRAEDGRLCLWFHQKGSLGAGICTIDQLKRAKVVGSEVVHQVTSTRGCGRFNEHETFSFPMGTRDAHWELFDIRAEACARFGFQHGDVVITDNGVPSTVIGVHNDALWFHLEGSPGAAQWPADERLKVIAHTTVSAEHAKRNPSHPVDWLKLDFSYACGLFSPKIEAFDTRDSICSKVGGFKHGQVVRVPGMSKRSVTIGVRRSDDGRVLLWFHVKGLPGAGLHTPEELKKARVVGLQVVRQMTSVPSVPATPMRAIAPPPKAEEGCARCQSLEEELLDEQRAQARLVREKKSLEQEVAKLRKLNSEKSESKEIGRLKTKLAQLRESKNDLIKSASRSAQMAARKERLKRETIRQELEAETCDRLMNELIQPKLQSLQQQSESVQREKISVQETSQQLELQQALVRQNLEDNAREARRLKEALERREQDAQALRRETKRLEEEIARQAADKAALAKRLTEQPVQASVDEETWQFMSSSGTWTSYPEAVNCCIMDEFMKGSDVCRVTCQGREYEIDFELLHQMNCKTEKRRSIRCCFGLPPHWLMSDEDALRRLRGEQQQAREEGSDHSASQSAATVLTTISEATRAGMRAPFKQYATKIRDQNRLRELEDLLQKCLKRPDGTLCPDGCLHRSAVFRVKEAFQVQNLYLWRRYQRFCKTIRDKQKQYNIVPEEIQPPIVPALEDFAKKLQVNVRRNERLLFHGTKKMGYAKAIATEGFDNRIAHRGLYGNGTYFAAQTCKSAQYGIPSGFDFKASVRKVGTMILSRVALGDPCYVTHEYGESRPPTKRAQVPDADSDEDERDILCDSVIARPGIPRAGGCQLHAEFVTFAPEQAYPEFILRYTEEE